ncbi:MAG: TetR/AcrR family transcriptional regulator [Candidatus Muiribacteriota bacterium]
MNTKEIILNNALELFSDKGYENTGVQEIALVSGVTKPTLYHYFGSKEGILEDIFREKLTPFFDKVAQASKFEFSYEEKVLRNTLENVIKCFFDFAEDEKAFYRFYLISGIGFNKSLVSKVSENYYNIQYEIIRKIFSKAQKLHGNMKGRATRFTITFIATINSYITLMLLFDEKLDNNDVKEACRQFMHGIFS